MQRWARLIAIIAASLAVEVARAEAPTSLPEPLLTAETEFAIPFTTDGPAQLGSRVQLYVSADRGESWHFYADDLPGKGSFVFRAPHSGEFWFLVRLVNAQGRAVDDEPLTPAMRVIVAPKPSATAIVSKTSCAQMPLGVRSRAVNSRSFELDYGLAGEEERPVTRVTLWWTADAGQTWQAYGIDDDQRSPMRLAVGNDGLFGFWLVSERGTSRDRAPRSGDTPQIWVNVDTQPPQVAIATAELRNSAQGEELVVRWDWTDEQWAEGSAAVWCAASPAGPWTKLTDHQPHKGGHACRIGQLPTSVDSAAYLRLTATDAAGNQTTFTTSEPVMLPARTNDATRAAASTARTARWYQMLR
ncbi:MAG: hypothetical protein JSS27_11560 [Planctomycetes bacterium]|nr:hypothetical protein [Planctomycetota bacterium]